MTDTRAQQWRILLTTTSPNRHPGYMVVDHDREHFRKVQIEIDSHSCFANTCNLCESARHLLRSTRLRYVTAPKQLDPEAERKRIREKDPACFGPILIEKLNDTPRRRRDDA